MLQGWVIVMVSFAYIGFLFAIAFYADKRADQGRSLISITQPCSMIFRAFRLLWTFDGEIHEQYQHRPGEK